jgi:thiol-disulfide isomerase/thioredoxin
MSLRHPLFSFCAVLVCVVLVAFLSTTPAVAEVPSVEKALVYTPIQEGVDYAQPSKNDIPRCAISPQKTGGSAGWIVTGPDGTIIRKFTDTNADNRVDQWCYYKDGLEVYRDVDANFNRKPDQYRWFNTAGCRWGIDTNEDGKIDRWQVISAEEAAAETVAALAAGDWPRLQALVLSPEEAKSLGLGQQKLDALLQKLATVQKNFEAAVKSPKPLAASARWLQSSGGMPGVVPAGTDGSQKDLMVYENIAAVFQAGGESGEVLLGTLVRVGDAWRLIDAPHLAAGDQASVAGGFFFAPVVGARPKVGGAAGPDQQSQALLAELEQIDQTLAKTTAPAEQATLQARRADLLEKVAEAVDSPANRAMWYHQLADTVGAAVQTGSYPDGAKRLGQLFDKLAANPNDKNLAAYVRFRQIMADYGLSFQAPKPDYEKIQKTLIENLVKYVETYPTAPEAPEAMLQLAMTLEFTGNDEEAKKWHEKIVQTAPGSPVAAKARGAWTRLDSVGKTISVSGNTPTGQKVNLADYRGKAAVLVQYWATWCEPAKADMAALKELVGKYGGQFRVIGVSLDGRLADLQTYLKENPLPWPQIYEQGGLDSRPANELGILTVPTMILVDKDGKVISRNISVAELDKQLKTMMR